MWLTHSCGQWIWDMCIFRLHWNRRHSVISTFFSFLAVGVGWDGGLPKWKHEAIFTKGQILTLWSNPNLRLNNKQWKWASQSNFKFIWWLKCFCPSGGNEGFYKPRLFVVCQDSQAPRIWWLRLITRIGWWSPKNPLASYWLSELGSLVPLAESARPPIQEFTRIARGFEMRT